MKEYSIAKDIRTYLTEHGIKCSFIAQCLGIKRSTLSDVFSGKRKLQLEEYITICNLLNVPVDFFIRK